MANYTCDFDEMNSVSEKLASAADKVAEAITKYKTAIDGDLASWTGPAKDKFVEAGETNITAFEAKVEKAKLVAEYIKAVSDKIAEEETNLTELKL